MFDLDTCDNSPYLLLVVSLVIFQWTCTLAAGVLRIAIVPVLEVHRDLINRRRLNSSNLSLNWKPQSHKAKPRMKRE